MKGFVSDRLHPILSLLLLGALLLAGLCVAYFLAFALAGILFGVSLTELQRVLQNPAGHAQGWSVLMLLQGLTAFVGLGGGVLAFVLVQGRSLKSYFAPRPVAARWLLAAAVLVLVSLPLLSWVIEWNANVHLPGFLSDWEAQARAKEAQLQGMIKLLTDFGTVPHFLVAVLVIAGGAAVGEELVFRGVVQRLLGQWFKSAHAGIWLSALIFSAIHLQFLGFVPRLLLGALFGYLYEWSGSILVPMAAHFTHNAFQLVLLYLQQRGVFSSFDPDANEAMPWPLVLLSVVLTGTLLLALRRWLTATAEPTEMHTLSRSGVAVAAAGAPIPQVSRTLGSKGVASPLDSPPNA
ncbi:CPBP family intramembrane metalloprotease [Hymenobacter sp. BT175]|uniref:CPBP family intramembrane glutamic endopeptidase n=1 Tax=Hymenobacter translucens TaxID=2886507 RepID=UPI001D0EDF2A|nr:CPBP family intramembrane glutamic endopeptidase [Hymenobacter translucens]MCC2545839.1 CPBP family intramembrane metalloprotease [Hymenobacter translucens]